jgi:hypothetical protein
MVPYYQSMIRSLLIAAALMLPGAASYADSLIVNGVPYSVFCDGPYTNIIGGGGMYTVTQDGPYLNVIGGTYATSPVAVLNPKQMPWVDPSAVKAAPVRQAQPHGDWAPRAMPIKKRYPDYQADVERSKPQKKESAFVHWLKHGI